MPAAPKLPGAWPPSPGRGRVIAASYCLPHRPARPPGLRPRHSAAHTAGEPSDTERISIVGLGGTGRGEMAPYSDLDLMFLVSRARLAVVRPGHRGVALHIVGPEAEGRPVGAARLTRSIAAAKSDMTIRTALLEGALALGRRAAVRRGDATGSKSKVVAGTAARLCRRQARRARRAPPPDGRQPLCRRAQRQGRQGRPARPPYALLDRPICVRRREPRRVGRQGPVQRRRIPPLRARRALLLVGALPPPSRRRPRRGAARLRHAAPDRGGDALCRPAGKIGGRALHAILFPEREGGRRPDRPVPRPA